MFAQAFVTSLRMHFNAARESIQSRLSKGLPPSLTYHNTAHTEDVAKAALRIAHSEGITDERELECLELACWMHDSGFLESPHQHEKRACLFVDEWLPEFGVDENDRRLIKQLIRATQLHSPALTLLEQIIQDADLDYLGREDYEEKANGLRREMEHRGQNFSESDWLDFQIHFLSTHRYNTASARESRQSGKRAHLDALRAAR